MTIRKRLVVYTNINSFGIYIKLIRLSLNPRFIRKILNFEDTYVFSIESNNPIEPSYSMEEINHFLNRKSAFSIINFLGKFSYGDFLGQKICIPKDIYLYIPWGGDKASIEESIRSSINYSLVEYENVTLYNNLPKHSEKIILDLDEEGGNSLLCDMLCYLSWEASGDIIDYQD